MGWGPEGRPALDARKAAELTTGELGACLEWAEGQLARDDLEPRRRENLDGWRQELLAEKGQRADMAEDARARIAAMRATGRQS